MPLLPRVLTAPVGRLGAAAQNALEVARFGGLAVDSESTPFEVVSEQRVYKLRRYFPDRPAGGPPILLVPPMMLAAEIYDVAPSTSGVSLLHDHGADPWVVDFGAPEREEGGLERTLADHVLAVSDAVDRVRAATGERVHLGGYSQGGMFVYQTAAYRRNAGLGSLITFGSPVDTRAGVPFGIPEQFAAVAADVFADRFGNFALPAWASRTGFRLLDPVKSVRHQIEFLLQLHDREALLPRERQRRFLEGEGWVAWPGPAMADFLRQFIAHNRMLEGGFVIEDRLLTLADLRLPILAVVGTVDEIAPVAGVRAIRQAAPRADVFELSLVAGHFGLVVGSKAVTTTWPSVAEWVRWRAGVGERPAEIESIPETSALAPAQEVGNRIGYDLELAGAVGARAARSMLGTARRTVRGVRELTAEAASQLPRLVRLEQIQPRTRISLGLLVEERARRRAEDTFFLFGDRAYTAGDVNRRIDNVVRGLIEIGVRRGEHIGVLMGPRPTALALVVALNRVGAVSVLLRPDGDVAREAQLGQITRLIADPERAELAAELRPGIPSYVLGGGGEPRDLGLPLTADMEQIDPSAVELPRWYRPNPGRARDVAFILFTGEGAGTRVSRITNRRWALSAFGTASSAALGSGDTVYSVTPLYHPSGLMMSVGGAVAGGARLAMATRFEPATFWEEVRRYGVTVTSYTWTLLHDIVEAPPHPGERHHPVRLFIGSGMPRGLWRRVEERFAPARVLEFYASTEAGAILVNLRAAKRGSMGRPLPGSSELRIAQYDLLGDRLALDEGGLAVECRPGQIGLLLVRVSTGESLATTALRGLFRPEDAWLSTGDLFMRDHDGDYWRVDGVRDVIRSAERPVFTTPIRDALMDLPSVDLAVAYGVVPPGATHEVAIAAVTLRGDRELTPRDIAASFERLTPEERPSIVHVVNELPVTTWYRPMTGPLKAAGLPEPGPGRLAWYRAGETYRPLTAASLRRLTARRRRTA